MSGSSAKRLHEAAKLGKLDEVREALEQEAVTSRDQWGETPLHWASSPAVAKALLDAMADVNSVDPTGDLPLHWASEHGQVEVSEVGGRRGGDGSLAFDVMSKSAGHKGVAPKCRRRERAQSTRGDSAACCRVESVVECCQVAD